MKKLLLLLSFIALPVWAQVTPIGTLRTYVDDNYAVPDTNTLYTAEGVVTSHTNLTTAANTQFYMQDNTGGIVVFVAGLAAAAPPAGTTVRVTGPLGLFNGLLELNLSAANTNHVILSLSSNNPLPAPIAFNDFNATNDTVYMKRTVEGARVVVSNVWIDLSSGANFPAGTGGGNVLITNSAGQLFTLRIDGRVELRGQVKPTGPVTIFGVMSIFDNTSPYTSGFQLLPTRAADIAGFVKAPTVAVTNVLSNLVRPGDLPTNTFVEQVLRTGEQISVSIVATDPDGGSVLVTPVNGANPPGATWSLSGNPGPAVTGTLTYAAQSAHAGQKFELVLQVSKASATNTWRETIYVPTIAEQGIVIAEFLANPGTNAPYNNPLNRPTPSTNGPAHDEFIELVNLSATEVDMIGWMLSDDAGLRHTFYDFFPIASSNAAIVYGGPLTENFPNLPVISSPLNPGAGNVSIFNNGGDSIILRNWSSNLVARVVYTTVSPTNGISMTRYPNMSSAFVPHDTVSSTNVSPGRQYDGLSYAVPPGPTNAPPTISDIADRTIDISTSTGPIAFTVGDTETPAGTLTLTRSSSDTALVPLANIVFGGSGANRTVTVTPVSGQSGTATITVTVTDERGRSTSDGFVLTVLSANNAPTITAIADRVTTFSAPTPALPFIVGDRETAASALNVTGASDNQAIVPDANIVFGGTGSNRTVTVTPIGETVGTATVSVAVSDGVNVTTETFKLIVFPTVLLVDGFDYADGSVTTNSGFLWNSHSGTTGQTQVASGALRITSAQSEDFNASLTNAPFTAASSVPLYAAFTVNFTQLPTAAGSYFAHFKDNSTGFRARIYSGTANAAAGTFRIGIANAGGTVSTQALPELQLSNTYTVVIRYDVTTAASTLWINPTAESDASVTAADATSTLPITSFAFRQAAGIGTMAIDNVKVGVTFNSVLPAVAAALRIVRNGSAIEIRWPATAAGTLESTTQLPTLTWSPVTDPVATVGAEKVVTLSDTSGMRFFRLHQ